MKLMIAVITTRRAGSARQAGELVAGYVERIRRYIPCVQQSFVSEAKLLDFADESSGRTRATLWLTDSRGNQISSTELASWFGSFQDGGGQQLVIAIGPADGWSPAALSRADRILAFGRITLPHELAAVVAAEQLYRALTIRAGHPYHSGH
jgi:23S rRNA (pseudouridine1915-N3)-methyltransferase